MIRARGPRSHFSVAALLLALALARPARADIDLWPLFESTATSTTILYPFYVHERDFLMIFPLYYRTNDGNDHHFLWPFLKFSGGRLTRAAPIWFSEDADRLLIFPLLYKSPSSTFFLVPPTYLSSDGELQAILPFYVRSRPSPSEDHLWIAWRLFSHHHDDESTRWTVAYLFSHSYGADHSRWTAFPLLFTGKTKDNSYFVVPPLVVNWGAHRSGATLFPLAGVFEAGDRSTYWILPFFRETEPTSSATTLFPLFWYSQQSDTSGRSDSTFWLTWPLYARSESLLSTGELQQRRRRFLFFTDDYYDGGRREFGAFGFVIHESMD